MKLVVEAAMPPEAMLLLAAYAKLGHDFMHGRAPNGNSIALAQQFHTKERCDQFVTVVQTIHDNAIQAMGIDPDTIPKE